MEDRVGLDAQAVLAAALTDFRIRMLESDAFFAIALPTMTEDVSPERPEFGCEPVHLTLEGGSQLLGVRLVNSGRDLQPDGVTSSHVSAADAGILPLFNVAPDGAVTSTDQLYEALAQAGIDGDGAHRNIHETWQQAWTQLVQATGDIAGIDSRSGRVALRHTDSRITYQDNAAVEDSVADGEEAYSRSFSARHICRMVIDIGLESDSSSLAAGLALRDELRVLHGHANVVVNGLTVDEHGSAVHIPGRLGLWVVRPASE